MGNDKANPFPRPSGRRSYARAFAQFMRTAVAKRPIEQFETSYIALNGGLRPDNEAYFGNADGAS